MGSLIQFVPLSIVAPHERCFFSVGARHAAIAAGAVTASTLLSSLRFSSCLKGLRPQRRRAVVLVASVGIAVPFFHFDSLGPCSNFTSVLVAGFLKTLTVPHSVPLVTTSPTCLTGTLSTSRLFSFTRCVRPRPHARFCFRRSLGFHPLLRTSNSCSKRRGWKPSVLSEL